MLTTDASLGFAPGFADWNDPNTGWQTEALGRLAAMQWLSGEIPWWNHYSAVGMPLAAEMQSSSLFLPFILLLALNHGIVLLKIAIQIIAGFATYALLRQLELRRIAATTGALLYEFNGCIAWTAHAPLLPLPFLPLLLLGIEHARAQSVMTNQSPRLIPNGWAAIAISIAFSLYAGFPETAYINGLLALVWAAYRLFTQPYGARLSFAGRVAAGGAVGLLLASPLLWSFIHNVIHSDLGPRMHVSINDIGQYAPGFALYLFPYLFGPIAAFSGNDSSATLDWVWSRAGGYLGLTVFLTAVSALFGGSRERGLRWLLVIWILVALGETAAAPGLVKFFQLIPLMDFVMFSRFAVSSWFLAAIILASFAIEDQLRDDRPHILMQLIAVALCAVVAVVAIIVAWPLVTLLARNATQFQRYPAFSLFWGGTTFAITTYLLVQRTQRAAFLLSALVVADAMVLFAIPQLSGLRHPKLDLPAIQFLQNNLGLQRFYTLGPFAPNYGAYFGLASINSDYQPNPVVWADYIRHNLDSKSDTIMFMGDFPPGFSMHAIELQRNLSSYRELGVKYVIAPANRDPFLGVIEAPLQANEAQALTLTAGKMIQGTIPGSLLAAGDIDAFGVDVGTFYGASTGNLAVELCDARACATGEVPLETAADNKILIIPLNRTLSVQANGLLRYTIAHPTGANVAIWLKRTANLALRLSEPPGIGSNLSPNWLLRYRSTGPTPTKVYADSLLAIFELPNPAPYFETRGSACRLAAAGRQEISVSCEGPAVLIRRELSFPGWHAVLNGRETLLDTVPPFFQTVELPAGNSHVTFAYSPPGIGWTYAAFVFGMFGLLAANVPPWPMRRRPAQQSAG